MRATVWLVMAVVTTVASELACSDQAEPKMPLGGTKLQSAKQHDEFRDYDLAGEQVKRSYRNLRQRQTHSFARKAAEKYCQFGPDRANSLWELFDMLKGFVDLSDPDINLSNHQHLFQTAEAIRADGLPDWFQFVGLVHDLGKVLHLKGGNDNEGTSMSTQWAVVGDTFLTGCAIPVRVPYPEFNVLNPDAADPVMATEHGVYRVGSGLRNATVSFGHDEYLYRMFMHNGVAIPDEGMYMIRYHSMYPWHKANFYSWIEDRYDAQMKPWVQQFNEYDLYTKVDTPLDEVALRSYYDPIVQKYAPGLLEW